MVFWVIGLIFVIGILGFVLWQRQELNKFRVTDYDVCTDRLSQELRIVLVTDLHSWEYGRGNERLLASIQAQKPDLIFIAGDLIVSAQTSKYAVAEQFCRQLVSIAPVYFANGNHEKRVQQEDSAYFEDYRRLEATLRGMGVHILNNAHEKICIHGEEISIYGLDLPLIYYSKAKKIPWKETQLTELLGLPDRQYTILLAHNPKYTKEYLDWGADLSLSGHYHGGLVCLPGIGSVVSPQFELFPKYSFGMYEEAGKTAITSRGLGTHTFHIRICNRAELVNIVIHGKK